jgi:transposase
MTSNSSGSTGITIGLDIGDRHSALCVLDAAGAVPQRATVPTTVDGLRRALAPYAGARVVLEVGTHSPWVSRQLTQEGYEVVVANPGHVRRIGGVVKKSDGIDAELLARLGRADPALLRPITHRGAAAQRDRALLRVRDHVVRMRTGLILQARGLAKALGTRLPRCGAKGFATRMQAAGMDDVFPGMGTVCEVVAVLTQQVKTLNALVARVTHERYPETARLRQVTGVGPITALAYVVTLEDPRRVARSRNVGPYLGLSPKRYQSGTIDRALGITKAGDGFLRRTLVQAAQYILGPFGPDTALRRFGLRLMARGGRAARKRAVIAVARKLAVLLHRLWISGERYEPLRGATTVAA